MADQSVWITADGHTWTLASFIIRAICQGKEHAPAEVYFVLTSLDEERFRAYWDHPDFWQKAGVHGRAAELAPEGDGAIALTGDYAWAKGDLEEARRCYERSLMQGDSSCMAGLGGLLRLHFACGEFEQCIKAFRRGCPPHAFYIEYHAICRNASEGGAFNAQTAALRNRYQNTSPFFISQAKYMRQAIVMAAIRAGDIDDQLGEMICDFFQFDAPEFHQLVQAGGGSSDELERLQRRVAPKPVKTVRTLAELVTEGNTERARRLIDSIPRSDSLAKKSAVMLDRFLASGNPADLDEMIRVGSPFGIPTADALVLAAACKSREEAIFRNPERRLVLLRRFERMKPSPIVPIYPLGSFFDAYLEVMRQVDAEVEPGDLIAAMLAIPWHTTPHAIDETMDDALDVPSETFGKPEIAAHRDWLEIVLQNFMSAFDRCQLTVPCVSTRVVNAQESAYDIYIGCTLDRFHFGNPASHVLKGHGVVRVPTPEAAVQFYKGWLDGLHPEVDSDRRAWVLSQMPRLKNKRLGSDHKPGSCHGDELARRANLWEDDSISQPPAAPSPAIAAIHNAYLFLRERYRKVRQDQRWFSEAQLADAIETLFGKKYVQRHARPEWLRPQHLDLYLRRHNVAIEYMGAQHYVPIEAFGGAKGLEMIQARDERKHILCEKRGVDLVYVTHEESIGRRAREIFEQYRDCASDAGLHGRPTPT